MNISNIPSNKPFAFIDIDGTVYNGFTIADIAPEQFKSGLMTRKSLDDLFAMYKSYRRGDTPYEKVADTALHIWGEGLKGSSFKEIQDQTHEFFSHSSKLHSFAKELVKLLKSHGYTTIIVTGEPQFVAQYFHIELSTDAYISSIYEVSDDIITGKTERSLGTSDGKLKVIHSLEGTLDNSFAFGDSEGDADMLELVTHSMCVNPTEGLRKIAIENNWNIVNENNVLDTVKKILS